MFKKLNTKEVYRDKWLTLFQDQIEFSNGTRGTYAWAERLNGVLIAVVSSGKILLQREFRYVIGEFSWEIPGGGVDDGEDHKSAAIRELREETGIVVSNLVKLGEFYPLNSFNTEKGHVFLAQVQNEKSSTSNTEVSEEITEQKFFSFEDALEMIDSGEINDAMTANIIQMVVRKF